MASRRARNAAPRDTTASCLAQVRAYLNDPRAPKNEQTLCFNLCGAASQDFSGDAVRMLLLSGAPVNGRDGAMSALIWAAGSGNAAAVRMLLDAGADPLALTADTGECALSLTIAHSGALGPPRPARADFLGVRAALARKRDTTCATVGGRRQSAVYLAAHFGADEMLKALLASGAEADNLTGSPARRSALFEAVLVPISCDKPSCKVSRGELLDRSFRMVKRLLAAGAQTRLRDMTSLLPVRGVAVTADLRVADAIFAAEAARGVPLTSEAEHGPKGCAPTKQDEADWLRGVAEAVEAFRAGGPAVLPEALRQHSMQMLDGAAMRGVSMSVSTAPPAGWNGPIVELSSRSPVDAVRLTQVDTGGTRAAMAAHDVERCHAEGCGAGARRGGGPLQACGACKRVKYCCKECQTSDWPAHKAACKAARKAKADE